MEFMKLHKAIAAMNSARNRLQLFLPEREFREVELHVRRIVHHKANFVGGLPTLDPKNDNSD